MEESFKTSFTDQERAVCCVRNVFHCDTQTDSLLVSRQERVQCQQAKYRAVHLSYLSLHQLEPLLQNFRYNNNHQEGGVDNNLYIC